MDIRPLPDKQGVGFFSLVPISDEEKQANAQATGWRYREEVAGRYHNFYVTPGCYYWPKHDWYDSKIHEPWSVVDAFSPNLDKELHVGHLRNLAIALSLSRMLNQQAQFVALLGSGKGLLKKSKDALKRWLRFVNYKPKLYYDCLMPMDEDIVVRQKMLMAKKQLDGSTKDEECTVWINPDGEPIVVIRGDGRPLYTFHDIAFAKTVGPTHYITGQEQRDHFKRLGLGDRHYPMGLVLGKDDTGTWSKMKSRTGDALSAQEVLDIIVEKLKAGKSKLKKNKQTDKYANLDENGFDDMHRLAWNVLAWNFLACSRSQDVKFDPDLWTDPNRGGLYITYTYARCVSALRKAGSNADFAFQAPWQAKLIAQGKPDPKDWWNADGTHKGDPDPHYDLTQEDANILGYSEYLHHYRWRAMQSLDPAHLANYAHDLARKLAHAYHGEKIAGGRYGFQHAINYSMRNLWHCLVNLGMFPLEEV